MGLMDKVKQGAGQALNKAQQGVSQGKAKIDEKQAKHQWDGLLRNLGAAYYAQQRQDGPSDAVDGSHVGTRRASRRPRPGDGRRRRRRQRCRCLAGQRPPEGGDGTAGRRPSGPTAKAQRAPPRAPATRA